MSIGTTIVATAEGLADKFTMFLLATLACEEYLRSTVYRTDTENCNLVPTYLRKGP